MGRRECVWKTETLSTGISVAATTNSPANTDMHRRIMNDDTGCREFIGTRWFEKRVGILLEDRGKTRTWLAEQLGISLPAVTVLLKRNNPKVYTCIQIAGIFGVPLDEIIGNLKADDRQA